MTTLAERAAAYALVEREIREVYRTVDVRLRSDHVTIISIEVVSATTLLDAVDKLREKSK